MANVTVVAYGGAWHSFHVSGGQLIQGAFTDSPGVITTKEVRLSSGCDDEQGAYAWVGGNGWLNIICAGTDGAARRIFWDGTHWRDAYGNVI